MLDLSIIVVNWNTREMLANCLRSIEDTVTDFAYEVIVVDNGSEDGSQTMLRQLFPQVCLIENDENVGFARANNQGMANCRGRYALLLNSDAITTPGAVQSLWNLADTEPRAGIVGAQLLNPDGSFQASHTPFPTLFRELLILTGSGRLVYEPWYPSHGPEEDKGPQIVDYVEGACMLVRREAFEEVGGLDEGYFMYAEEVDWCYAMRERGWQVWYQPAARVVHLGSGSSQNRRSEREADLYRSRVRFFRKHYGDRAAWMLKKLICGFTALKIGVHKLLFLASGGRAGRTVVSLRHLSARLRDV
ncbi:MAG: glycosyltransferase family 2 protein [Chloroflexi bacterium]|nr:glycosyltransferase family 2 protein [Chloroflexota bacterium]